LAKRADGKMGLTLVAVSEAKDAPNEGLSRQRTMKALKKRANAGKKF
jgi:hypothetical protein